jgi:TM2 domain-containing membrane protein YozV
MKLFSKLYFNKNGNHRLCQGDYRSGGLYMRSKLYISLIIFALGLSLVTCGSTQFYTGSGGKGISLAILTPKATGLAEQGYIPALVQETQRCLALLLMLTKLIG